MDSTLLGVVMVFGTRPLRDTCTNAGLPVQCGTSQSTIRLLWLPHWHQEWYFLLCPAVISTCSFFCLDYNYVTNGRCLSLSSCLGWVFLEKAEQVLLWTMSPHCLLTLKQVFSSFMKASHFNTKRFHLWQYSAIHKQHRAQCQNR